MLLLAHITLQEHRQLSEAGLVPDWPAGQGLPTLALHVGGRANLAITYFNMAETKYQCFSLSSSSSHRKSHIIHNN